MTDITHVFLDLDGTLVGSLGDVRESVWRAIEALDGRVGLSVCTGRPRAGVAQRIAQRLSPEGLHIFENGGLVGRASGAPLMVAELPEVDRRRIAEAARDLDATVEFYTPEGIFVSRLDADCREHARAIGIEVVEADLSEVSDEHAVIRAHWIMREPVVAEVLAIELEASEIGVASSPVLPGMIFGSVTRLGVTKGSAAHLVAATLGFSLEDAAGIGDAVGDLPLLEAVGHPFVVANASQELLERFTALGHVDDDGIEGFLSSLGS